ncbi:hypothetical protein ACTXT7_013384 [Hymenolepis weldensis]
MLNPSKKLSLNSERKRRYQYDEIILIKVKIEKKGKPKQNVSNSLIHVFTANTPFFPQIWIPRPHCETLSVWPHDKPPLRHANLSTMDFQLSSVSLQLGIGVVINFLDSQISQIPPSPQHNNNT